MAVLATIPQYVYDYAPLVYMDPSEKYFPSDLATHLNNVVPEVNFVVVPDAPSPLTLDNVDALNSSVYLSSKIDYSTLPPWLVGVIPDSVGDTPGAKSSVIVSNDHGNGNLDAYYFYFYSYNQGNTVFGQELGDHVGDWEHNMIRFKNGVPTQVWFDQHGKGQAFTWGAVEKQGNRMIAYSGRGTHATWASAGRHPHAFVAVDYTGKGALWDPVKSAYKYTYDATTVALTPVEPNTPVKYLNFAGRWGDQQFNDSDPRQAQLAGQRKYVNGPTGPRDKQLNRTNVCPDVVTPCVVRPFVTPTKG